MIESKFLNATRNKPHYKCHCLCKTFTAVFFLLDTIENSMNFFKVCLI